MNDNFENERNLILIEKKRIVSFTYEFKKHVKKSSNIHELNVVSAAAIKS